MIRNFVLFLAVVLTLFATSCVGEMDNIEKYSGETVYPAAFDTIYASYGFERIEFDLSKYGRIPTSQMKLGKAVKTVVEYDNVRIVYDTVCSWVNITGLDISRMYRFKIYTEDKFGNYSMPKEMGVIPFTQTDIDNMNFPSPSWLRSSTSVVVEFPASVINSNMVHNGLSWSYKDVSGQTQTGAVNGLRFFASNFTPASNISIDVTHKIRPRMSNTTRDLLLDEVTVTRTLQTQLPSSTDPFIPAERDIMNANGITTFTPAAVASVTKLTYPLHTTSFQDLFYFPSVNELDLTGEGLPLPTLAYDRNNVTSKIGGGEWQPFMRGVRKESDINISGIPTLVDLIEAGQVTKIRFMTGGRMGLKLEAALQPYYGTVVEVVNNFPDVVFMPPQFFVNGVIQDAAWTIGLSYSGDFLPREDRDNIKRLNPANETVNNAPVDLKLNELIQSDGKNIYKCVMERNNATFWFGLPTQYMFDSREYRYIKFKMMALPGIDTRFLPTRLRIMNYTWAFGGESSYGQQNWGDDLSFGPTAAQLGQWVEVTVDMNGNNWWGNDINTTGNGEGNRRNRVICFNFGREAVGSFTYDADAQSVIYVADIRFTKTQ